MRRRDVPAAADDRGTTSAALSPSKGWPPAWGCAIAARTRGCVSSGALSQSVSSFISAGISSSFGAVYTAIEGSRVSVT